MIQFRIVEIRADVFSVERYEPIAWFLPWIKEWQAVECYVVPQFCEYSPLAVCEFTREQAEDYIKKQTKSYYVREGDNAKIAKRMAQIVDNCDSGVITKDEMISQLRDLISAIRA